MRIAIVQLFDPGERETYGLGLHLNQLGAEWVGVEARYLHASVGDTGPAQLLIDNDPQLGTMPFEALTVDAVVWRISENNFVEFMNIYSLLAKKHLMINNWDCTWICADKWRTSTTLATLGIPVIPTSLVMPGQQVPKFEAAETIVKPAVGAGGKGVRLAEAGEILDERVAYVAQPLVAGPSSEHIRVIVCGSKPIVAIHRVPTAEQAKGALQINNVAVGGIPVEASMGPLHQVASRIGYHLKSDIIGVDFVPWKEGYAVLEVNSSPGFNGIKESLNVDCFQTAAEQVVDQVHHHQHAAEV